MATIPQRYRGTRQSGGGQANFPVSQEQPLDYTPLSSQLDEWTQRSLQEGERRAQQAQQEQAVQDQAEAGPGELASPDEDIAGRFQDAYREQAIEFHSQQLELDGRREIARLAREHEDDPDGFRQSISSYAEGTRQALEETDPTYATEAQQQIMSMAEGTARQLADRKFSRQQAVRRQETVDSLQSFNAEWQRELLNSPDEEKFRDALDDVESKVTRARDSGLITPEAASQVSNESRQSLTREYLRGEFQKDVDAGDFDGARSIVESLQKGKWFDDNEQDRRLASQLSQELESSLPGQEEGTSTLALRRLRQQEMGSLEGAEFDQAEAEQYVKQVQRTGTPNQRAQAIERFNGAMMARDLRPDVETMSVRELDSHRERLAGMVSEGQLSSRAFEDLSSAMEKRKERVQELTSRGRFAELGGTLDWSQDPRDIAEQARQRPERAARVLADRTDDPEEYDRQVGQLADNMPLFTGRELREGAEQYRQARERGQHQRAAGVLEAMTAPFEGDPARMAGELSRAGEVSGELYAVGVLGQMGQAESADRLMSYASEGRSVMEDDGLRSQIETNVLDGDVEFLLEDRFSEEIDAAAMGNGELRRGLRSFLRQSLYGRAAKAGEDSTVDAEEAIESWLGPLSKSVQFSNGRRLPRAFMPQERADALTEEVNRRLDQARKSVSEGGLGVRDVTDSEVIQPTPLGNGQMGFKLRGRWIMNDEGNGPVQVAPPEPEPEPEEDPRTAARRERRTRWQPEEDAGSRFEERVRTTAESVGNRLGNMLRWPEENAARRAAQEIGANENDVVSVIRTVRDVADSDPSKLHGREGIAGLSASDDDRVDWDRVSKAVKENRRAGGRFERTIQDATAAPYAAADLMRQAQEKYPDDKRAQLAAFYEGPEAVEEAREIAGEDWFSELPHDTQAVLRRMERYSNGE